MNSICFTGHRNLPEDKAKLIEMLYFQLEQYIKNGTTNFYAGGAIGWDTLAALTVIKLRNIYPQIKLHLILPCPPNEQIAKWSEQDQETYKQILTKADSIEHTSNHLDKDSMKIRNTRLIEQADICFCYYNPKRFRSGTGQTVRMAKQKQMIIVNFYGQTER